MTPDSSTDYYRSQRELLQQLGPGGQLRLAQLESAIREAFAPYLVIREVGFVQFGDLTVEVLADAFHRFPVLVKPILASANVAGRAIRRDLGLDIDTYNAKLNQEVAGILAGYVWPLLSKEVAVPALVELERFWWVDKEMRKSKANWEVAVRNALNKFTLPEARFAKRKFQVSRETFEIDAASPPTAMPIEIAVDVKRIESPRDIHKRADEIVNKAANFAIAFPRGQFFVIVYYPFPHEHMNLRSRLDSPYIRGVFFASDATSSIEQAARFTLDHASGQ